MVHLLWLHVKDSLVSIGHDPIQDRFVIVTGKNAWTRKRFHYESFEALAHVLRKHISEEELREKLQKYLQNKK